MPTLEVKCTVANCFFHKKDNICGAETIEINMDYRTSKKGSEEFAADFDLQVKSQGAAHSTDTCCNTFISKKDRHQR